MRRQAHGRQAENLARAHLERAGLRFERANFNCRFGEIDLIMWDRSTLVFVEVRSRTSAYHLHPLHSIDNVKQRKLVHTAQYYLQKQKPGSRHRQPHCRFDVVTLLMRNQCVQEIRWIKAAFDGES